MGYKLRILLVDDHVIFRDGLKFVLNDLESEIEFVEAGCCEDALICLQENSFDLILLDLHLPDSSGTNTLRTFIKQTNASSIVVLSGEDSPSVIRETIEQGASGFIPKSSNSKVLTSALTLIINGGIYLPPNALDDLSSSPVDKIDTAEQTFNTAQEKLAPLSERQREVLINVVQGKSNKAIARCMNIAEGTVKSHLSQAFRALGVKNRTEAVYAVSKLGISTKIISQ